MGLNFMLIDDNEIDLFVNRKFIERTVGDVEILTFIRAKKALDFLSSLSIGTSSDYHFIPDIILLDINMPEMSGFEFLDAYSRLQNKSLTKTKIFMLSSSTNVKDRIDADRHSACQGFLSKPLSCEMVQKILEDFMPALN
ncbi:response regulator [Flagellimonas marina]|uniref:Response regulator n=1 Tax=Flagellimonas marina TaxID=1775168 RepID=A0ABV8PK58_9FLAO